MAEAGFIIPPNIIMADNAPNTASGLRFTSYKDQKERDNALKNYKKRREKHCEPSPCLYENSSYNRFLVKSYLSYLALIALTYP